MITKDLRQYQSRATQGDKGVKAPRRRTNVTSKMVPTNHRDGTKEIYKNPKLAHLKWKPRAAKRRYNT